MKKKTMKIAAIVASVFVLSACGKSAKEEFLDSCLGTGVANKTMCECQYNGLKKLGSDSDIKHLLSGDLSKSNIDLFQAGEVAMECVSELFK